MLPDGNSRELSWRTPVPGGAFKLDSETGNNLLEIVTRYADVHARWLSSNRAWTAI